MGRPSKYSDEFRRDAVALYRAAEGQRTFAAVAKEIGVSHGTLRNWVRAADAEPASTGQALSADERAELARLRRAEREWQVEKEILRRAAVDSTGRCNTSSSEVLMGRPAGWMAALTGRSPMKSPGAPTLRREVERQFWRDIEAVAATLNRVTSAGVVYRRPLGDPVSG
ncbi:transposase [Kitasatospora sp. NPDC051914]|uniref:transposase n=1 Tax=Kitasatospora sp. NPDC051914 TaxID=3154945 RepID=UPI00344839B9